MATRNTQGLTVTYAALTFATAEIVSFDHGTTEVPILDASNLSTTGWRDKITGKLKDPGTLVLEIYADPDIWDDLYTDIGTSDTITITFPVIGAQITGATIAGSGFIVGASMTGSVDELVTGTITIAWDGALTVTSGA